MNILILTTRLNLGGIGIYTTLLARGLKQKGHKVFVASSGGDLENALKEHGIGNIYIPIDTSSDIGAHTMLAAMKLLKVVKKEKIQIVHAQTRVSQVIAYYIAKFSDVVFVSTWHGFFKKRIIRKILPCHGSRIIAISDAVRENLVNKMNVPKNKIELIYNGIDADYSKQEYLKYDKEKVREEFGLKQGPVIGITARLSDVKGHNYLLRAIARLKKEYPEIQLFAVGSGKPNYEKKLYALTEKLGICNNVIFKPGTKYIHKALRAMDIFVLPSIQEGLGLSLLEALSVGLPVVASNVGGIYSVIQHEKNGLLVPPRDDVGIASSIKRLLEDELLAKKLGEEGENVVRQKFSLDEMIQKVEDFYLTALSDTT